MNDQENNDKGFLKEKLGNYQVNPPENVWTAIASHLGGSNRRTMLIIALSTAATIAVAITLGINYFAVDLPEETGIIQTAESETNQSLAAGKESFQGQSPITEPSQDQIAKSALGVQKESLEEKVVRTMEEISEEPSRMVLIETAQGLEEEGDNHQKENVEQIDQTEKVSKEGLVNEVDLADEQGLEMDPPLEISLDPGDQEKETLSETVPEIIEKNGRGSRWIVGAAISPLYSFRDAEASAMASASEYESGLVSYAGGIHVSYRTASRLAIETGIFFNKMGISIGAPGIQLFNQSSDFAPLGQEANRVNLTSVTNSIGNIVASSGEVFVNNYKLNAASEVNAFADNSNQVAIATDQGIRQHLDYLELPFNLRYTLVDRDIELQLVGGMSTNFLVNNFVTMESSMGTTEIGYLTNVRSINYSGNAGIGMIYHLHERLSLHLEPRFRYFLNSVNDASLPTTRPYTLGIFTGLSYIF